MKTIKCPRCYGKGFVDYRDINRLGMRSKWSPGSCNYCGGSGKVSAEVARRKSFTGHTYHKEFSAFVLGALLTPFLPTVGGALILGASASTAYKATH
jgi:hypothetical protein